MNKEWMILKECFIIGCFTGLAIVFEHWWIVLFAWLFIAISFENKK